MFLNKNFLNFFLKFALRISPFNLNRKKGLIENKHFKMNKYRGWMLLRENIKRTHALTSEVVVQLKEHDLAISFYKISPIKKDHRFILFLQLKTLNTRTLNFESLG